MTKDEIRAECEGASGPDMKVWLPSGAVLALLDTRVARVARRGPHSPAVRRALAAFQKAGHLGQKSPAWRQGGG